MIEASIRQLRKQKEDVDASIAVLDRVIGYFELAPLEERTLSRLPLLR